MKKIIKPWGYELIIHNSSNYCGKILVIMKNCHTSFHYHKNKNETFYVNKGEVKVRIENQMSILKKGDSVDISQGVQHQIIGLHCTSEIIEFSSEHRDTDTYRSER